MPTLGCTTAPAGADADAACAEAMELQMRGHLSDAQQRYQSILQDHAQHPTANYCFGMLCVQQHRPADALPFLLRALEASPEIAEYWLGYIEALLQSGQLKDAREAVSLGRQHGLSGAAVDEFDARLAAAAPAIPTRSRAARRREAQVLRREDKTLLALVEQRRFADALTQARRTTTAFPQHGLGWKILGAMLWAHGSMEEAVLAMRRAAALIPGDAEIFSNLGTALASLMRFDEAEPWLKKALSIDPSFAPTHYRLGMHYELQSRYQDAEASLRRAIALQSGPLSTDDEHGYSNLLYVMSHKPDIDAGELFAEHRKAGARFEADWRAAWPRHPNVRDVHRRLKIGFMSGDFRDHSVAMFLEPVLAELARSPNLEMHAYSNYTAQDRVTERLRSHFRHWLPVAPLTHAQLTAQVTDHQIDILIDLSGHTAENRMGTFARKPAPLQVSWLGYPGTTGLLAMDYYLADELWLPSDRFERLFTEKLVYLPDRWAFLPHADAPEVGPLPAAASGHMTFGSFHRPGKINAATIELWSNLLHVLPDSTLLLAGINEGQQIALLERFADRGIPANRLKIRSRCPIDQYLGLHNEVDIALDAVPYAGATTTMHSLSMGVPTLTVEGQTSWARACSGILRHAQLEAFIASNAVEFVERAVYWAHHTRELADLRTELRPRLAQAPCGRPALIATHLEGAFRQMWRRWCAGQPAESFHSSAAD
jgi:predicted O-linked N-acetylglucosamine transferase (SPINDLY family)